MLEGCSQRSVILLVDREVEGGPSPEAQPLCHLVAYPVQLSVDTEFLVR